MAETGETAGGSARPVRVLAFTCSRHRPLMLRHCIMQMRRQTYPVDHAIYVNSDVPDEAESTSVDYDRLIRDAGDDGSGRLRVGYGPSHSMHRNHVEALQLADLDAYDLFLKVDDDDIYFRSYAEGVVKDFAAARWDFSGTHSQGWINGRRWIDTILVDLGQSQTDRDLGVLQIMPPTTAFSRRAIDLVLSISDRSGMDDIIWRRALAEAPNMVMAIRNESNFVYNIHGGNVSTGVSFEP